MKKSKKSLELIFREILKDYEGCGIIFLSKKLAEAVEIANEKV